MLPTPSLEGRASDVVELDPETSLGQRARRAGMCFIGDPPLECSRPLHRQGSAAGPGDRRARARAHLQVRRAGHRLALPCPQPRPGMILGHEQGPAGLDADGGLQRCRGRRCEGSLSSQGEKEGGEEHGAVRGRDSPRHRRAPGCHPRPPGSCLCAGHGRMAGASERDAQGRSAPQQLRSSASRPRGLSGRPEPSGLDPSAGAPRCAREDRSAARERRAGAARSQPRPEKAARSRDARSLRRSEGSSSSPVVEP